VAHAMAALIGRLTWSATPAGTPRATAPPTRRGVARSKSVATASTMTATAWPMLRLGLQETCRFVSITERDLQQRDRRRWQRGLIDCKDPACLGDPSCFVPGHEICNNGLDDDDDGLVDCKDPDCFADPTCIVNPGKEICDNGKDDNGDGLVDCSDPQCKTSRLA